MRFIRLCVAALLAATALIATTGPASAASATATFVKTGDWGSGWQGQYTITNGSTTPLASWKVEFDLPAGISVGSSWDARMTRTGQHYVFDNLSWNGSIAPGASRTFGFLGTPGGPSALPLNCKLNGGSCTDTGGVPGTPGTPTVTGVTDTSISLAWTGSSGTVTGYRVYEGANVRATVTGTTATISGLALCQPHTYTVKAYNSVGESAASGSVTGTTSGCQGVPGVPGTPTVSGKTNSSLTLAWTGSSGTVTGYRVYEGANVRATVTGTTATISGLGLCEPHTYTVKAYNSIGESAASGSVSGTTDGCRVDPLPKHFLTGYWQNFTNPAQALRLSEVPRDYDLVAVAFADATSTPGELAYSIDPKLSTALNGYTNAQFTADVATLKSRGQKVILSVGGELGRVQVASSAAATAFSNSAYNLIQTYGFDGIDIDLENGLNATYMAQALRQLHSRVPGLIITMAPQTIDMQSTGGSYFQLALAIKDILTVVFTQYYNSGTMLGCDQAQAYGQGTINFMTALACIQLENGLREDQVALGLPAGPGAAGGGIVAPSMVNNALDCLAKRTSCGSFVPPRAYPGIRGAMTWSINWDATHNWNFSRTVKPHLAAMP
ncbi:cellulose binding domain-containing protein [Rhizohabitans arisaemae]|uniref:cellulose binding domain-containing protein n=1 Tax=Rhizohabitans arisaemae TaxID=2720610 RepID=UPI0024B278D9|nr:cellulose binding domain-containing protein [Rhizohabitans arisaemae]